MNASTYPWQLLPVDLSPIAPATFLGHQDDLVDEAAHGFDLWNLTEDIPGHPEGSSVTSATLLRLGFRLPAR